MKLVTYVKNGQEKPAIYFRDKIYDFLKSPYNLPKSIKCLLKDWNLYEKELNKFYDQILLNNMEKAEEPNARLLLTAPIPNPTSLRDAYAFRQHVATSRRNRGLDMIPEFDEFPVFYFGNHQSVVGPGKIPVMPDHLNKLDFELEIAIAIKKKGINIKAEHAQDFIAGYMIMNDFSARALQMQEMKLNLGPAKGKDFATALGPWLVTTDELMQYLTQTPPGHKGTALNLEMKASVNGKTVSQGNLADMDWTFGEIIERASYGTTLFPGDVIGSGTIGTGCFLELNGTGRLEYPNYQEEWLHIGDTIKLEITGLGTLTNIIVPFEQPEILDYAYCEISRIN